MPAAQTRNNMEDLKAAVATAFANVVASGAIEQAIEKQLTDTISSAIRDHLREYSDFGKAIKLKVQQAACANLEELNLPSYNDLILQVIRRQMDGAMQSDAAKQLEENMAQLLVSPPAEVTLEQLLDDFINQHKEDKAGEEFTLLFKRQYGSTWIYLDEDGGKSEYQCAYRIAVDSEGKVYALTLDGKDVQKTLFMGPFYRFERTLFQLYAAKSKLIVGRDAQPHDFDTSFPYND